MAEHPNVSLLRKAHEAFAKGDVATITELSSEDFVWHLPGAGPLSGDHRGRDAVFAVFGQMVELSGSTYRDQVHDILANDEHTVVLRRATATRPGKHYDSLEIDVYHIRNGKMTECWSFPEDQRLTDEFWS